METKNRTLLRETFKRTWFCWFTTDTQKLDHPSLNRSIKRTALIAACESGHLIAASSCFLFFFFGPSLPPVSPSSLCYISPSWPSTQPEQCSFGPSRKPWGRAGRQMEMFHVGECLTEMFSLNLLWSAIQEGLFFFFFTTQTILINNPLQRKSRMRVGDGGGLWRWGKGLKIFFKYCLSWRRHICRSDQAERINSYTRLRRNKN